MKNIIGWLLLAPLFSGTSLATDNNEPDSEPHQQDYLIKLSAVSDKERGRAYKAIWKEKAEATYEHHMQCPWEAHEELKDILKEIMRNEKFYANPNRFKRHKKAIETLLKIFDH